MRALAILPVVATLTLLAGCGSDDTGSAADPAPTTVTVTDSPPSASPAPSSLTPTASDSPSSQTGDTAECTVDVLEASLSDDAGGGAAGSVYSTILLTNTGTTSCSIEGFGGVSYVGGGDGEQVGAPARRTGDAGPAVLLAPGEAAGEKLQETEAGSYGETDCDPTPVDGLRVYPPDSTESLFVKHPTTGCADRSVSLLTVSGYAAVR